VITNSCCLNDPAPFRSGYSRWKEKESHSPLLLTMSMSEAARFAPVADGAVRWIAYTATESGREEIFLRPFSGSPETVKRGKWHVSTMGGTEPRWRSDGHKLFFFVPNETLMAVDIMPGETFSYGQPRTLAIRSDARDGGVTADYDIAPGGQRFLISGQPLYRR